MVELPRVTFVPEWGVPDADWDSGSVAINALGQVAGYLVNDHLLWFGLIWEAGRVSVIAPDDARYLFEAEYLYPAAINASGTTLWYQDQAAVLWDGATVRGWTPGNEPVPVGFPGVEVIPGTEVARA